MVDSYEKLKHVHIGIKLVWKTNSKPVLESNSSIFKISDIWLYVWNIPLHWISYEVGNKIGHALSETFNVSIPESGSKDGNYYYFLR